MNNKIIVLAGLTGVGKDTIAKVLNERFDYNFIVSMTTRPMRENEKEGDPYYFVDEKTFFNTPMIENRVYNTLFNGKPKDYYYGVPESSVKDDKKYVVVLDVGGTEDFIRIFGDRIIPIMLTAPEGIRESRSIGRGNHDISEWERRNKTDTPIFNSSHSKSIFKEWIEVTNVKETIAQIEKIIA